MPRVPIDRQARDDEEERVGGMKVSEAQKRALKLMVSEQGWVGVADMRGISTATRAVLIREGLIDWRGEGAGKQYRATQNARDLVDAWNREELGPVVAVDAEPQCYCANDDESCLNCNGHEKPNAGHARPDISDSLTVAYWVGTVYGLMEVPRRAEQVEAWQAEVPAIPAYITRVSDYVGHWRGEAWLSHHTYGVQAHRSMADAVRWCEDRVDLRPAISGDDVAGLQVPAEVYVSEHGHGVAVRRLGNKRKPSKRSRR